MAYTVQSITDIVYRTPDNKVINCNVKFAEFDEVHPFSASASDVEEHGVNIYNDIVSGKYGPIAAYVPPEPPTTEQLWTNVRIERSRLLRNSDYTQMPDFNASTKSAWAAYRQELRDIPQNQTDPANIIWPSVPTGA